MASANSIVGETIKALEVAGVEALAVSLPEARVVDATLGLARRWNFRKSDLIGRPLSQSEDGVLRARYIDADLSDAGTRTATRLDVTYRPEAGGERLLRFTPQLMREGAEEFLLLIGPSARGGGSDTTAEAEAWRALATGEEGSAPWSYDLRSQSGETAPEILGMLGLERADASPSFLALDARVHPDDENATMTARVGSLSDRMPVVRSRYRLRHRDGNWRWVAAKAALMKDPATGEPAKILGLLRDVTAEGEPRQAPSAENQKPDPRPADRAREASDRLTADIARDFRLLLAGAHGNLRLAEEAKDRDEIRARIRTVIEALERGVDLSNRLIDFSEERPVEAPFRTPLPESLPEASAPPPSPAILAEDTSPAVLIVEDNEQVRDVARAMVEDLGYPVWSAASGSEALEVLQTRSDIRLLLSDVVMAGMMGPELAHQALRIRPELKILFASGYGGETMEGVEKIPQVVGLISKPFTREELTEKVRRAMSEALAA
ncbi:MAG: response regulator [Parvibaculaceae bacterium]